mgnify:CR=1 FL=1
MNSKQTSVDALNLVVQKEYSKIRKTVIAVARKYYPKISAGQFDSFEDFQSHLLDVASNPIQATVEWFSKNPFDDYLELEDILRITVGTYLEKFVMYNYINPAFRPDHSNNSIKSETQYDSIIIAGVRIYFTKLHDGVIRVYFWGTRKDVIKLKVNTGLTINQDIFEEDDKFLIEFDEGAAA